jgi:hypothetical protein
VKDDCIRLAGLWLACALGATVTACSANGAGGPQAQEIPGIPPGAANIEFQPIEGASTIYGPFAEGQRRVIRDPAEWGAFWNEVNGHLTPIPGLPAIDFSEQTVIAAIMGERPSGGHTIRIEEMLEDDGRLFAVVVETSPGPNCITTQVITSPVATVAVERVGREVEFVDRSETLECP